MRFRCGLHLRAKCRRHRRLGRGREAIRATPRAAISWNEPGPRRTLPGRRDAFRDPEHLGQRGLSGAGRGWTDAWGEVAQHQGIAPFGASLSIKGDEAAIAIAHLQGWGGSVDILHRNHGSSNNWVWFEPTQPDGGPGPPTGSPETFSLPRPPSGPATFRWAHLTMTTLAANPAQRTSCRISIACGGPTGVFCLDQTRSELSHTTQQPADPRRQDRDHPHGSRRRRCIREQQIEALRRPDEQRHGFRLHLRFHDLLRRIRVRRHLGVVEHGTVNQTLATASRRRR